MQKKSLLEKIPEILSSRWSIMFYLFLFLYLVIFGLLGLIPALKFLSPSSQIQLVLGNYTNVLGALGAAIAAGMSASTHTKLKEMKESHDKLHHRLDGIEEALHIKKDDQ